MLIIAAIIPMTIPIITPVESPEELVLGVTVAEGVSVADLTEDAESAVEEEEEGITVVITKVVVRVGGALVEGDGVLVV